MNAEDAPAQKAANRPPDTKIQALETGKAGRAAGALSLGLATGGAGLSASGRGASRLAFGAAGVKLPAIWARKLVISSLEFGLHRRNAPHRGYPIPSTESIGGFKILLKSVELGQWPL
jgi:hypothetical protein